MKTKKFYFRYIFSALISGMIMIAAQGCSTSSGEKVPSQVAVISGLDLITLTQPIDGGTNVDPTIAAFGYSAGSDIKHMILFLCSGSGASSVAISADSCAGIISGATINLKSPLVAGNSTSKSMGASATAMKNVYTINGTSFSTAPFTTSTIGFYSWFIVGYDSGGLMIGASDVFTFTSIAAW